jgi:type IV secretion system protein VirB10
MKFFVARLCVALMLLPGLSAVAQTSQDSPQLTPRNGVVKTAVADPPATPAWTVPSGTKIPLTLKQGVNTKSARPGDPVYAQTAFPITQNNQIVIPAGTFVQGQVERVVRPGHVKGKAELQMSFTSMIFPNGYTVMLPGAVQNTPGSNSNSMKGKEGTIEGPGGKGKDAATVATTTVAGAGIGAIADGGKGAGIGAGVGGALGLATVLLSRGPEVDLGTGSSVEMVLESNIELDPAKVHKPASSY